MLSPECHPERSDAAEQQAKSNFCGMEYPSRSRIRNRAKAQATIPGTVPCDVPEGHVTAGLSPVLWRSVISERFVTRCLHLVTFVMQKDRGQNNANAKTVQRLSRH